MTTTTKLKALTLLRRHDRLQAELRALTPALNKACADYGRSIGLWGYRPDHLRMDMARAEQKEKAA